MALVDCGSGIRLERGAECRLTDGITLVSDHYYPAGGGPWPTLLMRQPYGRDIASTVVYAHPVWFARHGYHIVIQDVRGRGGSEGVFYPFRHEGRDGDGRGRMVTVNAGSIPEIALNGVTKRYRNAAVAVESISLTVERGEFVTFLGPSGCGKSTLLKLVSGLSPVSEGTVRVNGMTPENARDLVSFIFQDATLLPWRTVGHNVGLGMELEHAARPARKERVAQMLELVGLSHVAKRYPRQLSGGMKMRASIARALVSRPRILLMDAPFAALDEMTRDRLNEELLRLYNEHKWTVLFVTHSVAEAVFLSTRVVILAAHPGRVAHEIKINLASPRTAETRESKAFEEQVTQASRLLRGVYQV